MTRLATTDTITAPLRARLADLHPLLDELLSCDYCTSVYAAAATTLLPRRLRYALALSGAVSIYRELQPPPF